MITNNNLDMLSALLSFLSAVFWGLSAFVKWPYGYDNDDALKKASKHAGWFNFIAALLMALATLSQTAKIYT